MGFLAPAEAALKLALAAVMAPPPPFDMTRWCEDNIVFEDGRSPMPGPFRIARFPFLREIHETLSPEHVCTEVTVVGSAQIGKTVSIIQPTLGAWFSTAALDALVVHPTSASAKEWALNKWGPMRRQTPSLKAIFGDGRGGDNVDAIFNQETLERTGSLKIASAGSPADLTGTTRRLVIMDDLAKWEMTDKGDPEALAVNRARAFGVDRKILRVSTPLVRGTCRISANFARSDQRYFHLPCPHCGHEAPLTWENFRKNLDPERLPAACFSCDACGCVIRHGDKKEMVAQGRWIATNPKGDHPGFHFWQAYVPHLDWADIAQAYAKLMGWYLVGAAGETEDGLAHKVEAATEQVFWNDVLGLPYEQASRGPDWEALRNRVENAPEGEVLPPGVLPARGFVFTAGVDCQGDRTEVHLVAFGANFRRWAIDYKVIPHCINSEECRAQLDALLKGTWRTERGLRLPIDMLAIDGGAFTSDVWSWAKKHPWSRVIIVKGGSSQTGPIMKPMFDDVRRDGRRRKRDKRGFVINVSQLKADFYGWLAKEDPTERGYVAFARGLGDEYYRMITSEVRVLSRSRSGVTTSRWDLVEPTRRNEGLDTMNYAEIAARRLNWAAMTDVQWAAIEDERGAAPATAQPDLFDGTVTVVPSGVPSGTTEPKARPQQRGGDDWIKQRSDWV